MAEAAQEAARQIQAQDRARLALIAKRAAWPACHMQGLDGRPVPFHRAQELGWESPRRIVAMLAGSQSGKTSWGPWWLAREIDTSGAGDYLAVTASFDLFKLKMLPAMREVFENVLGIARYWAGDRILELRDPQTGEFRAKRANDSMWGRIILRSAESPSGLESATAKAGWADEAGQDGFELDAWRAIRRRLALHRGRILITTTLYNLGWLKQQVIDPAMDGGSTTLETLGNGAEIELVDNAKADIGLIQFDSITNPMFPLDEYDHARDTMPDDEFQMFYRGRVAKLRTLIYDVFDRRLHTCPRFEIPKEWKRFLGLDFGGVNTAGLFFAEEPGTGKWYGYREYLAGGKTAAGHAESLKAGEPMLPITVGGSKSEGQWRDEFRAGGLPVREPDVSEVDVGISRVYGALKSGELIFFDDLQGTLDQIGRYKRKRDKAGEVTQEIEQKNSYHYLDSVRYIVGWGKRKKRVPKVGWL